MLEHCASLHHFQLRFNLFNSHCIQQCFHNIIASLISTLNLTTTSKLLKCQRVCLTSTSHKIRDSGFWHAIFHCHATLHHCTSTFHFCFKLRLITTASKLLKHQHAPWTSMLYSVCYPLKLLANPGIPLLCADGIIAGLATPVMLVLRHVHLCACTSFHLTSPHYQCHFFSNINTRWTSMLLKCVVWSSTEHWDSWHFSWCLGLIFLAMLTHKQS